MLDREWINRHPKTVALAASVGLLMLLVTTIVTYLPKIREELNWRRWQHERERSRTTRRKYTPAVVKARLTFEKIPFKVKDSSGKVRPLKKKGRTSKFGDSLDVMWFPNQVLFMKEKGLFEQVLAAGKARFSDFECDGRNVWVSIPKKGIWILDTSGQVVAKVGSEHGLPPGERGLLLNTIEPGKMFAVGSFGRFGRGWCAMVEFNDGAVSVNVFHEAKRVPQGTDDEEEIMRDPSVVFRPYWIRDCLAFPQPFDPNIVILRPYGDPEYRPGGRRTLFVARCERKFESTHRLRYPLEIDINALSVRVSSRPMTSLGIRSILPGPKLEYNGKLYLPGRVWQRFDPNSRRKEKLVTKGQLPDPYGSLRGYWVSAHYGLAGWAANRQLYQIMVTDEEHDMTPPPPSEDKYYHIIVFEDANGAKPQGVHRVRLAIHRKDKPTLKYIAALSGKTGYYPVGRYEAWGAIITKDGKKHKEVKVCDFEPIEITEDSPVRLVMRAQPVSSQDSIAGGPDTAVVSGKVPVKPPLTVVPSQDANTIKQRAESKDDSILHTGQVVHAITGEPMAGAFVMAGFESNLAWITREDWEKLHKLPTKPSIRDETLWPIKNTSRFKLKRIVRTDANGQFEMRFQRSDIIHEFVVFEEDYLTTVLSRSDFGRVANGRLELPKMPLYPAAKIMIEPRVNNVNLWLRFVPDEHDNSQTSTTFFNMYGGYSSGPQVHRPCLEKNLRQPFHVPSGFNFKMYFSIPYDDGWCIPDIPRTIHLKQGETLDLGRYVFEPAIKIFIKVIDSTGEPVVGVRLAKLSHDPYKMYGIHRTDKNGLCPYYVEPNSEPRFNAFQHEDRRLLKSVTLKIGGREDEGKEFTIKL